MILIRTIVEIIPRDQEEQYWKLNAEGLRYARPIDKTLRDSIGGIIFETEQIVWKSREGR